MSKSLNQWILSVAAVLIAVLVLLALTAPWLPIADPNESQLDQRLLPPLHPEALLGTDTLGRDIFSRLIWGLRVSLLVAIAATLVAAVIGSSIGILAGYARSWFDQLAMRGIDLLMAFPYLILALAIVAILGPGLINALLAIAIVNIPFFARTARGITLGLTREPFIEAARMGGQGHLSVLFREVLPNVFPTLLITSTTTLGWMILETAGLSFLGLGAQPPTADLGSMLADGRKLMLVHPHVALLPGLLIFVLVLGLNLLGDGLRDRLDPRLRGGALNAPGAATTVESIVVSAKGPETDSKQSLLSIRDLVIEFGQGAGVVRAVDGFQLEIHAGQSIGLVGESGSGKSATAMAITRLLPSPPGRIAAGSIEFDGRNLLSMNAEQLRRVRGKEVAYIFQDPLGSLNPLMPVGQQVAEAIHGAESMNRKALNEKVVALLEETGLPDPATLCKVLPHELSGGQRQRIGIAMALANDPRLIIADEPTTALDVTVQRKVLELLDTLRKNRGTALLFISHDLAVVQAMCSQIVVLKDGRIVEAGESETVLRTPKAAYTRQLIEAIPSL
ncbi:MAG: dipeptide/oligopeptide/nickel ABC transporter permease/ATP-binding protein [Opitutales bacterium]|nr:dipeptide/oligopeptide/nickel ABC transporter permease/ATP-binding protein [Opitutales bacterium]